MTETTIKEEGAFEISIKVFDPLVSWKELLKAFIGQLRAQNFSIEGAVSKTLKDLCEDD